MSENKEPPFLVKAKETQNIHAANLKHNDDWTLKKTAKALSRSIGSISEDLMIVRWWRIHPRRVENFTTASDCLEWIRDKEKEAEEEVV